MTRLLAAFLLLASPSWAAKPKKLKYGAKLPERPVVRLTAAGALIAKAAALVHDQPGRPADEIRALDKKLLALDEEAAALDHHAVPELAAAALDEGRPLKLRLWLVAYLDRMREPRAFPYLKRAALDPRAPDLLREAAAHAVAESPVAAHARADVLCAALDAEAGPQLRGEALLFLARVGCADTAALERAGRVAGQEPFAVSALARAPKPAALDALERLYLHYQRGSPQRVLVLEAWKARLLQLGQDSPRWSERFKAVLSEEARHPAAAVVALELVAALPHEDAGEQAARLLRHADGRVVVAAAEALTRLRHEAARPAVRAVYDGFYSDPRFAPAPGVEPTRLYERLGAALKALK